MSLVRFGGKKAIEQAAKIGTSVGVPVAVAKATVIASAVGAAIVAHPVVATVGAGALIVGAAKALSGSKSGDSKK